MNSARDDEVLFNGIDGATGRYLWPAMALEAAASSLNQGSLPEASKGARFGVDVQNLGSTGWGVVFAAGADPEATEEVSEALDPLVSRRREQASHRGSGRCRVFAGQEGYQSGETAGAWLVRHGAGPGPVNPKRVPYYLLLVGSPEEIPFAFQFELAVQHAVGRIAFETVEEYARYATSVVAAEEGEAARSRPRVALWAPDNPDDRATALSSEQLVGALISQLTGPEADEVRGERGWRIEPWVGVDATKDRLSKLCGGADTPALLFTASHGVGFGPRDRLQRSRQGALITQEWPGPEARRGPISQEHYFCADDVGDDAQLHGLIAFFFACYGAGTPSEDDFSHLNGFAARTLAERPFMARLPQRLLAHPNGGALAVVGHVDRAWGFSFMWAHLDDQVEVFRSTLLALLANYPVGAAMEAFSQRYAEISTRLLTRLHSKERGRGFDPSEVLQLWTATQDAKSYVILGDPAVRLAVAP